MLDTFQQKNVQLHCEEFEKFFEHHKYPEKYDLVYVDGNHCKKKTLEYFKILCNKVTNDSVIIFDDIYWNKSMQEAWLEIIKDPKVTVSVDTFRWGLIFFRKEQHKQHFYIRM